MHLYYHYPNSHNVQYIKKGSKLSILNKGSVHFLNHLDTTAGDVLVSKNHWRKIPVSTLLMLLK